MLLERCPRLAASCCHDQPKMSIPSASRLDAVLPAQAINIAHQPRQARLERAGAGLGRLVHAGSSCLVGCSQLLEHPAGMCMEAGGGVDEGLGRLKQCNRMGRQKQGRGRKPTHHRATRQLGQQAGRQACIPSCLIIVQQPPTCMPASIPSAHRMHATHPSCWVWAPATAASASCSIWQAVAWLILARLFTWD